MRNAIGVCHCLCLLALFSTTRLAAGPSGRATIDLNGVWNFDQTRTAFPPAVFTRKIPVPGLIHLAEPKVDQYDTFFSRPDRVRYSSSHNLLNLHYEPRYNWYRRLVTVPKELEGSQAVLSILKSKYVTQVFVNGMDAGTSMACYTPVEFPVTHAIKFGAENEILVRVGDRAWLPSAAAGSTDKEKVNYLPGIWDDVALSFTGGLRVHRALVLPAVREKKATVKIALRSFHPAQATYGARMRAPCRIAVAVREARSGQPAGSPVERNVAFKHDNVTDIAVDVPLENARLWSPDDPFLYTAAIEVREELELSDRIEVRFGMRDFERRGRHFALNGKKILLRGTNITLHRFFEDPDCAALPWDPEWVRRLLAGIPQQLDWNAMRICVGIAPQLWYDIADEAGLLVQNEWLYWQNHGWNEQIRAEYTDWVWTDGSHPSIVIWDAINENWDEYVGNALIPELKELDPTRIWDAGYMTSEHMLLDEMDEPHPYRVYGLRKNLSDYLTQHPYPLGDLHDWPANRQSILTSSAAQLVNEYGWMWLWRDGRPSKLMESTFRFYLGDNPTSADRRSLQAYWEQLQTEWLRTERSLAGVLSFCYLTNNYGFTGDWFVGDVKDLEPGLALEWFAHCFAPAAVFIDLVDERYTKHVPPHAPGSSLSFNLVGVNDHGQTAGGKVVVTLHDSTGREVARQATEISIPAYFKRYVPLSLPLPETSGGYLLLAQFTPDRPGRISPVISRRYIKVGEKARYAYHDYRPRPLK